MKAVVLLSGGQDSVTSLFWTKHRLVGADGEIHALSVNYGQRHAAELESARNAAQLAGCASHVVLAVGDLMQGSTSGLVGTANELTLEGGMPDRAMPHGLPSSFVPGRNLGLLALAVVRAGAVGAEHVVTGVCQTDYSGYPDCRAEFVRAMQGAVSAAWPSGVQAPVIHTPLMDRTKAETVLLARELAGCWDALAQSVTCYRGERPGCGTCASCVIRAEGFARAGLHDPAVAAGWSDMMAAMRDPAGTLL